MKKIRAHIVGKIISSNTSEAHQLYDKSCFGQPKSGKVQYTLSEAMFLVEKHKLEILSKNKPLTKQELMNKFKRKNKKFPIKYIVYKDLREKGYVVKTALKFGAEFRVYDKGKRPGKAHAKWIVFTDHETGKMSWPDLSAKMRVAHSTKKKLLLAIVDQESEVSYYEMSWIKA